MDPSIRYGVFLAGLGSSQSILDHFFAMKISLQPPLSREPAAYLSGEAASSPDWRPVASHGDFDTFNRVFQLLMWGGQDLDNGLDGFNHTYWLLALNKQSLYIKLYRCTRGSERLAMDEQGPSRKIAKRALNPCRSISICLTRSHLSQYQIWLYTLPEQVQLRQGLAPQMSLSAIDETDGMISGSHSFQRSGPQSKPVLVADGKGNSRYLPSPRNSFLFSRAADRRIAEPSFAAILTMKSRARCVPPMAAFNTDLNSIHHVAFQARWKQHDYTSSNDEQNQKVTFQDTIENGKHFTDHTAQRQHTASQRPDERPPTISPDDDDDDDSFGFRVAGSKDLGKSGLLSPGIFSASAHTSAQRIGFAMKSAVNSDFLDSWRCAIFRTCGQTWQRQEKTCGLSSIAYRTITYNI